MVKYKEIIFAVLILFFLTFSFYPTIFELSQKNKLTDPNREFILEHNYFWPDFNLYLSKIRQGWEGNFLAQEKYTSELHKGSLLQEFYVVLGQFGKILSLDPNLSYQLGRFILSPLLLLIILLLVRNYFHSFRWQVLAFLIVIVSASFPRFYTDSSGFHIGRFMEWWSNIDALQRITFIPHILFGQVVSFYLLYQIIDNRKQITKKGLAIYIILGNLAGLAFPPSLITLNGVIILLILLKFYSKRKFLKLDRTVICYMLFVICSLPSLLYLLIITKQIPWSALVEFHRTHPMMIPLDQYILGTGPIFFLGFLGAVISIAKRDKKYQPLIFWIITTLSFAAFFSVIKEQSPLRFTQTGLFIPLGILGAYFFQNIFFIRNLRYLSYLLIGLYLLINLYMMKVSLNWQTNWIGQRLGANIPAVPYPPQTVYPLKDWMNGIRWLRDNTNHNDVVLAQITAGNYIPAYSGNTVYFGQANTVDYERKKKEVDKFFKAEMTLDQAQRLLQIGTVKYVFYSVQEKELGSPSFETYYPMFDSVYTNPIVTIFRVK